MLVDTYRDLDLSVHAPKFDKDGLRSLVVALGRSPMGTVAPVELTIPKLEARALGTLTTRVEDREIDVEGAIELGETLADLLLPDPVRDLFVRSVDTLPDGTGLRIRLRLDPELATMPWEYAHVAFQAGQRDATGFLALNPRLSIVRDDHVVGAVNADGRPRNRRIVVALASPEDEGLAPLDLAKDRAAIEEALDGIDGLELDVVADATVAALGEKLKAPTDVFHFAGHGRADALVLEGPSAAGAAVDLSGEALAVNLLSRGVQLAVLGACDSGQRSDADPWSGVAIRLLGAGIPAAVAMQYRIGDKNAAAFGRAFYAALAAGVAIDGAVAAGRLAVFNRMDPMRDGAGAPFWRDWGVPVLYLRDGATVSLAAIEDEQQRAAAKAVATINVDDRVGKLAKGGRYTGVAAGVMRRGRIVAKLRAGELGGQSSVVRVTTMEGGAIDAGTEADSITGDHTTVVIDELS